MNQVGKERRGPLVRVVGADAADVEAAAREVAPLLRAGGLVAFPTETVYGLGANALDPAAVARVFAAKGRPSMHPLIVHIADAAQLPAVAAAVTPLAERLAAAFWPGPLTLVLPRAACIPDAVTGGLGTVGVRVPAHPIARAVIAEAGVPIAAPSANPYTRISPTTAAHVLAGVGERIDAVLDGGATDVGIESTVVDACGARAVLLRPGGVGVAALEAVVGPVDRPVFDEHAPSDAPRPSPGMSERHYAPRARLVAVARDEAGRLRLPTGRGAPWAVVSLGDERAEVQGAAVCVRMPVDAVGYARRLFAALHDIDAAGCAVAYVEVPPAGREWEAVADRLRRAGLGMSDGA